MNDHSPDCDANDINAEGIEKPCNCHGRITEAALLIANVFEQITKDTESRSTELMPANWLHHERWSVAVNRSDHPIMVQYCECKARLPLGGIAVWDTRLCTDNILSGVFSANEGYLNNADEFIADMKELLEKEAV